MAGIPSMLRKARKAAAAEDFATARDLYAEILQNPEKADDLDLMIRHAWCLQHLGEISACMDIYRQVVDRYMEQGEVGAAESLQRTMSDLQTAAAVGKKSVPSSAEPVVPLAAMDVMEQLSEMGKERHLAAGEMLCRFGDAPNELWVVRSGKLRVELPEYEDTFDLEATAAGWLVVGEIGYYTLQRRSATLVAEEPVHLFEVQAQTIRERCASDASFALAVESIMRDKWVEPVLARHSVFEKINDVDRRRLAHAFELVDLDPGKILIEAGEEHDGAYMVRSGCMFFLHGEGDFADDDAAADGKMLSVMPGEVVHLGGLLTGFVSPYRVVAATPVQLLRLSRKVFEPYAMRRPWIIPAILKLSKRPVHMQVMQPEDAYLWLADRTVTLGQQS